MHEMHVLPDLFCKFYDILSLYALLHAFYRPVKRAQDAIDNKQKYDVRNCGM
jgi:hypothetical protein